MVEVTVRTWSVRCFADLCIHLEHILATPSLERLSRTVLDAPFSALSDHSPELGMLRLLR